MNTQPANITAQLRKQGIKVDCRISRYVGVNKVNKASALDTFLGYKKPFISNIIRFVRISKLLRLSDAKQLIKGNKAFDVSAKLDPNGGLTRVTLFDVKTGAIMGYGEAICSDQDAFNRSRGYQIALNRAIKNAKISVVS